MPTRTSHLYTKEEIIAVIKLWETKNIEEITEELGLRKLQVFYLATKIREAGYKLPRKSVKGRTLGLIKEVISEL